MEKISIIGAGCWGTTLAYIYAKKINSVILYEPVEENYFYLQKYRHPKFFKYVKLQKNVYITNNLNDITESNLLLLVLPSIYVNDTLQKIKQNCFNLKNKIFISCIKGLDYKTNKRISELIKEILKINEENIFVLSGPSHAEEVALCKPTAVTVAGKNIPLLKQLQKLLSTEFFRVYYHTDIVGVEIAGTTKNIYAIAAGICDGLNLGSNAKSALLTRSLKEMILIGEYFGAKKTTFFGLSGIGDLLTTAYSKFSRNRTFGEYVAKYKNVNKAKQKIKTIIEGIYTIKVIHKIFKNTNIELPIADEVYKIVYKNKPPELSIKSLLSRPLKEEFYWYKNEKE